jgi:hypothetical protein
MPLPVGAVQILEVVALGAPFTDHVQYGLSPIVTLGRVLGDAS